MKKKILVVENDKEILNILSYIFNDEGYEVKSLQSLEGLIETIHTFTPDAILLDIIVPGVEDTEICRSIKSAETTKHIPLIVLSTHPIVAATIKEICADEIISKPFELCDLVNIVNKQIAAT